MLRLPVNIHQKAAQAAQQAQVHGAPVHPRNAAAIGAQFAPQNNLVGVIEQIFCFQQGGNIVPARFWQPEDRLYTGAFGAAANLRRISASANHRLNRIQNNGFARTGLTREGNQPGAKTELQMLDDGKILDSQFGQHGVFRLAFAR